MNCRICEAPISSQNESRVCRSCRCGLNRMGPVNDKRLARLAEKNRDPEIIAKRLANYMPVPPIRRKAEPPSTFEQMLAKVKAGAPIREVIPFNRRADPQGTLAGNSNWWVA